MPRTAESPEYEQSMVGFAATSDGEVSRQLQLLDSQTKELHDTVTQLEGLLQSVLRPMPAKPEGEELKEVRPVASPIGAHLRELSKMLAEGIGRLQELAPRLDI